MPRGGRRPNTGGSRPGSGRKLAPETIEFRAFWRRWFDSPKGRKHLVQRAKKSDAILAKLIDKCFPTPTELDVSFNRIPSDLRFVCELTARGGPAPAGPVDVPDPDPGVPGD
jgi:hypothetical protein